MCPGIFQDRFVNKPAAHIKAFAGEILSVLPVMVLFIDLYLVKHPTAWPSMEQHVACLKMMALIIEILWSRNPCERVETLMALAVKHHDLYLELYGQVLAGKPKMHFCTM